MIGVKNYFHKIQLSESQTIIIQTVKGMLADTPLVKNLENQKYLDIILNGKTLEERFAEIDAKIVREELLRNINLIARFLNTRNLQEKFARITGPIPKELREKAGLKPLVLATPTVDIGFNFGGKEKKHQNIDFGYFDARYDDQFFQRLGRIGRVLGKPIQNCISNAEAFIPEEAYILLKENLCSASYDRDRFKEVMDIAFDEGQLMKRPMNTEYSYIRPR